MKDLSSYELNVVSGGGDPNSAECKRAMEAYDYAHGKSLMFTASNPADGLLASGGAMIGTEIGKAIFC
ncbi:TPA: hypothetical protein LC301_004779 [Salmonella enterica subsp. enterica serovar Veneziana]|nr:hypothetical protein [Salmonella enterica subsp. enterica serovar Veneziana]